MVALLILVKIFARFSIIKMTVLMPPPVVLILSQPLVKAGLKLALVPIWVIVLIMIVKSMQTELVLVTQPLKLLVNLIILLLVILVVAVLRVALVRIVLLPPRLLLVILEFVIFR